MNRRNRVLELSKAGLSHAEIGRRLGISRERVRQIGTPEKPPSDVAPLTRREQQIVAFIAQGYSNKEIADALSNKPKTVCNQVAYMMKKLGLRNGAQLAIVARRAPGACLVKLRLIAVTQLTKGGHTMTTAYCMKCKRKVEIRNPMQVTLKNNRPAVQGICSNCGTKVFRIGKA